MENRLYRWVVRIILSLAVVPALFAQAPGPSTPAAQNVNVTPGSTALDSNTLPQMTDKLFNTESDSVDFEEGLLNWKGRTFNLGNNRLMRARFERYLGGPSLSEEQQAYLDVLKQIENHLSLVNAQLEARDREEAEDNVFEAWRLLFKAGEYPEDNGCSLVIANLVHNAWRVRKMMDARGAEEVLQSEKKRLQNKVLQDAFWQEAKHEDIQRETAQGQHTGKKYGGVTQGVYDAEQLVEVKARIAALDTNKAATGIELKIQYQSQIVTFLMQRRYQHTLIAAAFYRHLFKGTHQGLEVGKNQLAEFLPDSNMKPTVDLLEYMAREAMRDVEVGMETVKSAYNAGELYGAMERLQETFFLGEYMPDVVAFEAEKKAQILEVFRLTRELQKLIDFKDYNEAANVVESIRSLASDFPASSFLTLINTARRTSNLHVLRARQLVGAGDFAGSEGAIREATELWPLNPDVLDFSENLARQADVAQQGAGAFDQLYESGDWRKIFDQRAVLGAAFLQDAERAAKLAEVVEKVGQVDFLVARAEEALAQENPFEAWEILVQAEAIYPDDLALQRLKAEVGMRASDYARSLAEAARAQEEGDYALALMRYLDARQHYPASRSSRLGLEAAAQALLASFDVPEKSASR